MLSEKVIVVTGGSGLLGSAFLDEIRTEGGIAINADVAATRDLDRFEHTCDISSPESVASVIAAVSDRYHRIDGWINNAYPRTSDWGLRFEDIPKASWDQNMATHLGGYFVCCQHVLEFMRRRGAGVLLNVSSIYGSVGPDFSVYDGTPMTMPAAYAAIKAGIINLGRYLASYYGPSGIRVNTISPGGIIQDQPERFINAYTSKVPLGRMATPMDIAPAAAFLLSDRAAYITGHNLVIDGGWTAI